MKKDYEIWNGTTKEPAERMDVIVGTSTKATYSSEDYLLTSCTNEAKRIMRRESSKNIGITCFVNIYSASGASRTLYSCKTENLSASEKKMIKSKPFMFR